MRTLATPRDVSDNVTGHGDQQTSSKLTISHLVQERDEAGDTASKASNTREVPSTISSLSPTPTTTTTSIKPPRKSRVLSRKTDHSVIERRRREKINERLIRLQTLIPACREEVQELFSQKPPKATRGRNVSEEARQREMERCLCEEMVLEKLCIISHSVDYILELQAQVEAYRKLCQCDPPLAVESAPRDPSLHVKYAHEGINLGAGVNGMVVASTPTKEVSPPPPPLVVAVSTGSTTPFHNRGPLKRKRHWGSDRDPKLTSSTIRSTSIPNDVRSIEKTDKTSSGGNQTSNYPSSPLTPLTVLSQDSEKVESSSNDEDDDDDEEEGEEAMTDEDLALELGKEEVEEREILQSFFLPMTTKRTSSVRHGMGSHLDSLDVSEESSPRGIAFPTANRYLIPRNYFHYHLQQQQQQQRQRQRQRSILAARGTFWAKHSDGCLPPNFPFTTSSPSWLRRIDRNLPPPPTSPSRAFPAPSKATGSGNANVDGSTTATDERSS